MYVEIIILAANSINLIGTLTGWRINGVFMELRTGWTDCKHIVKNLLQISQVIEKTFAKIFSA